MNSLKLVVFSVLVTVPWSSCDRQLNFPPWFKFGVAVASYQVEGAWNVSDKGESIWDRFAHQNPPLISNGSTGDIACDSYHLWRRDIEMAEELGLDFYRFSISWPRLLPDGYANNVSEDGKRYYSDLIDGLLKKGIEPVVTLYHWDLPQKLQEYGGWINPVVTDLFGDYARIVFSLYGDRVKTWLTFNEPINICDGAYNLGSLAPGIVDVDRSMYICNKNVLLAHAKAWRIYDKEFKPLYNGKVSLANNFVWFEGKSDEDEEIASLANQYSNGRYAHPIYSRRGGWPPAIEKIIAQNSKRQGYPRSRLPAFTPEEVKLIRGTYDFFGLNFYIKTTIRRAEPDEEIVGTWFTNAVPELRAVFVNKTAEEIWPNSTFAIYPQGMRSMLNWIKEQYGDISILITENGFGTTYDTLEDYDRIEFYKAYLEQVSLAIDDGVDVIGYTAWSIMDNLEWSSGYRLVEFSGGPGAGAYFGQRVSLAIQAGNAASLMGTLPPEDDLDSVFYLSNLFFWGQIWALSCGFLFAVAHAYYSCIRLIL